jgi:Photosynthetic reaction centre cytochrome C subunit
MKKSLLVIAGCIVIVILFQAFTVSREPHFKNLQILPKDISDHDLDSVMHHFSAALGVRCNFCHVVNEAEKKWDMASDEKPEKNIARKMMLMSIDINKNYFKGMNEHDMDHDHDMSGMAHDSAMAKVHDTAQHHDMANDHVIDTTMGPSGYMLMSVTCYTCHRGDPHPESKTPPRKEGPPPPPKKDDNK